MDGPCHMSEEVQGASMAPSRAILNGWGIMFVMGELLVVKQITVAVLPAAVSPVIAVQSLFFNVLPCTPAAWCQ